MAIQPAVAGKSIWPDGLAPGEGDLMVREGDLLQYISEGRTDLAPELDDVQRQLAKIRKDK